MAESKEHAGRPILVAIDFSPFSEAALLWAVRAAECMAAPLIVLHVVHDPGSAPGYYSSTKKHRKHLTRIEEAAADMMSSYLEELSDRHSEIGELDHRLVVGLPVTRILEVADQIEAQLIVMGSRGRTGLPHALLGSKAEKVVQLSEIPVTIVKNSLESE